MKNIVIILLVGCVVLMMWKISDNQPPSISSNSEVVPQKIKRPVEKKIIRLEKKQNHTPIPVPKSINLKKTIQKIDDEEEAPIVPLERPDDKVYPPTKEGIDQVVKIFLPNIVDCYDQALEVHPDMGGRLRAAFRIEKPKEDSSKQDLARISDVEILDSDIDHEHFENCIMDNIDQFWFDPPQEEYIDVQYPFVFIAN